MISMTKNTIARTMLGFALSWLTWPVMATPAPQQTAGQVSPKDLSAFVALMNVFHVQAESFYVLVGSSVDATADSCTITYKKLGYPLYDLSLIQQKRFALQDGHVQFGDVMKRPCLFEYNDKQQVERMTIAVPGNSKQENCILLDYDEQGRIISLKDCYASLDKKKQSLCVTKTIAFDGDESGTLDYVAYSRLDAMKYKKSEPFTTSKLTFGKDASTNKYFFERFGKNHFKGYYVYNNDGLLIKSNTDRLVQQQWLSTEERHVYQGTTRISTEEIKYSDAGISERSLTLYYKKDSATGKLVELTKDDVRRTVFDAEGNANKEFKLYQWRQKTNGVWSEWMHYTY